MLKMRKNLAISYLKTGLPENSSLGKFCRALEWNVLSYFMDILNLYGPLVYLVVIWYIFRSIGMLYQEKSGNPA
jgi:uncharacterized membrane protein